MNTIAESTLIAETHPPMRLIDRIAHKCVTSILLRFDRSPILLQLWDGSSMRIGSSAPELPLANLQITQPAFFKKVLYGGEVGFGEAYVEGLWRTDNLPLLLQHLIDNLEHIPDMSGAKTKAMAFNLLRGLSALAHWQRRNTRRNSKRNIREHYDLSNDFYSLWLDKTLTYSSAWFEGQDSLEEAQEKKYDRLCQKLRLQPGMRVLEIGCGWGGFSLHAAQRYGVHVTAITISEAQQVKALERVHAAGLQDQIDIRLCDYRDIQGQFDAIASIEMLEAVGHQFLKSYFDRCHQLLKPTGRLGIQVIVCPDSRYEIMRRSADWIKKHIFPGGQLPSIKALIDSANETGDLYLQHLENFGLHYAKTLQIWREKFNAQSEAVRELGFDETFMRKWNYYLAYCEAAFTTRNINVSQLILSRPNNTAFAIEA